MRDDTENRVFRAIGVGRRGEGHLGKLGIICDDLINPFVEFARDPNILGDHGRNHFGISRRSAFQDTSTLGG